MKRPFISMNRPSRSMSGPFTSTKGPSSSTNGPSSRREGPSCDQDGPFEEVEGRFRDQDGPFIEIDGRFCSLDGPPHDHRRPLADEKGEFIDKKESSCTQAATPVDVVGAEGRLPLLAASRLPPFLRVQDRETARGGLSRK